MAAERTRPAQPRIAPRTDIPEDLRDVTSVKGSGKQLNIFATLAHAPNVLRRFSQLGGTLLFRTSVGDREREIVILRVGWNCRSVYEFGQHTAIGLDSGISEAEIKALTLSPDEHPWSGKDLALIALADDLCADDCVSDATWDRLRQDWDERQLVELVVTAGFYVWHRERRLMKMRGQVRA